MKQYTGTKTVKAMPMTMGEAYERKLLKNGVRPSECETDKAGYLVEYEDGYQSWSPADSPVTVGREISSYKTMNKEKAIELIKEVEDTLFLVKGMCIGKDEHLMAYMDLNMQRCEQAIKVLED